MSKGWIYHNTHEEEYRSPFGAVPCCTEIVLRVALQAKEKVETVIFRCWENSNRLTDREMQFEIRKDGADFYAVKFQPSTVGLYWYYFVVIKEGKAYYYGNNQERLGGEGILSEQVPPAFQLTVYKDFKVPGWFNESVMYQIFVDRFYNGNADGTVNNPKKGSMLHGRWDDTPFYIKDPQSGAILRWDFFGGNLQGIIEKLPYLKELGIGVIYLNPIFESPSNHKYDTADYKKIDPMFGTNKLFRQLCTKARRLKMRIILDAVFSHTGSDSIYFNKEGNYPGLGAYQSQKSPYYRWYRFTNFPEQYESWWGIGTLPNVNELEPSYVDFMLEGEESVVRYWLEQGAAGWRLDVADELPDEFIQKMRQVMKETAPDSLLLGEVWEDASNKVSYGQNRQYLWGEELDSVMNYPFRSIMLDFLLGRMDAHQVHRKFMSLYENYPRMHFYNNMNLIGTHDVPRILTLLGEAPPGQGLSDTAREKFRLDPRQRRLGLARLKLLALFQMVFPGVPAIYYGDEAGMEGYADPYNRGPYPWGREEPKLKEYYKKVIALRNNYPALQSGRWLPLVAEGDVYGFLRADQQETFLAVFNRHKEKKQKVTLQLEPDYAGVWREILPQESKETIGEKGVLSIDLVLQPLEGKLLIRVK